jgi:hypothetical protein
LINFIERIISKGNIITFGSVGLIFYIAALILSKTTKCIIIWHWWDIIILAIPGIIFLGSFYMVNCSENKNIEFVNSIALNLLFVFSFAVTILLSLLANIKYSGVLKSLIYILIVIGAKIFIAIIIPFFIILFFGSLNYGEKDKRYKSGRKGNKNIIIAGIMVAIAALLVSGLIKNGVNEE